MLCVLLLHHHKTHDTVSGSNPVEKLKVERAICFLTDLLSSAFVTLLVLYHLQVSMLCAIFIILQVKDIEQKKLALVTAGSLFVPER